MGGVYVIILAVLFALSLFGLVVGVSNDAAGVIDMPLRSKVTSLRTIRRVAAVGVVVGAVMSGGMMNVARFGFFHPESVDFHQLIMLYLGVMLSYVLLLELFITLHLPTSTSVALVFCLFGATIAVAVVKLGGTSAEGGEIMSVINTGGVLVILFAILFSLVAAFVLGVMVMMLSRLFLSIRRRSSSSSYGFLWCGLVLAVILCFVGAGCIYHLIPPHYTSGLRGLLVENRALVFLGMWVLSSLVLRLLHAVGMNLLKITMVAATFFLSVSFASNDLLNFLGVPLAAWDAYGIASSSDIASMASMAEPVEADRWVLLGAGVMMAAVILSIREEHKYFGTSLDSSSRADGKPRYGSSLFSRVAVNFSIKMENWVEDHTPLSLRNYFGGRLSSLDAEGKDGFDKIRLIVNIMCAAVLVALGTDLGLPLSTTYAIFMVSMGSRFADKAWRGFSVSERVTGVSTVIIGWFVTAVTGVAVSLLVTFLLMALNPVVAVSVAALCLLLMLRGRLRRRERGRCDSPKAEAESKDEDELLSDMVEEVTHTLTRTSAIYRQSVEAVLRADRKMLRELLRECNELYYSARERKYEIYPTLQHLEARYAERGHYYVLVVDYLSEITKSLLHITRPCFEHVDNNYRGMSAEEVSDLLTIAGAVTKMYEKIVLMLRTYDFTDLDKVFDMREQIFEIISQAIKNQLRRVQGGASDTKVANLYLTILGETKTMVLQSRNLIKSQSYFVERKDK